MSGTACRALLYAIALGTVWLPACATAQVITGAADPAIVSINSPNVPGADGPISGDLINYGDQAVTADVVFYRGDTRSGDAIELGRVAVVFTPGGHPSIPSAGIFSFSEGDIFSVCIDPDLRIADANRNNNCAAHTVSRAITDFTIATQDISIAPVGVNVGEVMTVTARVHNIGDVDGSATLRLWQGHPMAPSSTLVGSTHVVVPSKGQNVAAWTGIRTSGDTNLWVTADDVVPQDVHKGDNLASRNIFLKTLIDTGRRYNGTEVRSSMPAIADLSGTGQPVMVFSEAETVGSPPLDQGRVTAAQVLSDGSYKELWSTVLQPARSIAFPPLIADLDRDGSPEIIVEVARDLTPPFSPSVPGEIWLYALDINGQTKWSHSWRTFPAAPCNMYTGDTVPALGDVNGDGVADVIVLEHELVVLDGRTGNELLRRPWVSQSSCPNGARIVAADLNGDGKNELIIGASGITVLNSSGAVLWTRSDFGDATDFALLDLDGDSKPEIVVPAPPLFAVLDAATGAIKQSGVPFRTWENTIAATTSLSGQGLPTLIVSQNAYQPATAALDGALSKLWFQIPPMVSVGGDTPMQIVLADVLGQGRPQVISRTDRRFIRIQDIRDGSYLFDSSIYGKAVQNFFWPVPVDLDGDGIAEIVTPYGVDSSSQSTKGPYEPVYPAADFLVFGSEHWAKVPTTWNQPFFNQGQVDSKLTWLNDNQPWKTHNTWRQQPLRKVCDADLDDDVDQDDIRTLMALRGTKVQAGDQRDIDQDGTITVADARACVLKCTLANCAVITPPAQILSVSPRIGYPGTTVTATIRGSFANFQQGVTTVSFGPGISVGPVTVLDQNTLRVPLTISATATGQHTVSVSTAGIQATRSNAFTLSPDNKPPVVNAGTVSNALVLPGVLTLSGTVTDDGLPAGGRTVATWQQIAGPGTVKFADPTNPSTAATFSAAGYYVLRLSATDGDLVAVSDVQVTVIAGNQAPLVSAGGNRSTSLDVPLAISGSVNDDGLPAGASVTTQWSKVTGPADVSFSSGTAPVTTATFSAVGTYQLRLTANDGELSSSSDVTVTVVPPLPRIVSSSPTSAVPGQSRTVNVQGLYTHFTPGVTMATLGQGISVGGGSPGALGPITITGPTSAVLQLGIGTDASLGPRDLIIRTGDELATLPAAFAIGQAGVPSAIQLNLSSVLVAPDDTISANPKVLDAAGNVLPYPASSFSMRVEAVQGATTGNAPLVNGLNVTFPKLSKKLINDNPELDPSGAFASGDPSDPNYGKETGGSYILSMSLAGTTLSASSRIVVLPSGTAGITLLAKQYSDQEQQSFASIVTSMQQRDLATLERGWEQLQQIISNPAFSSTLIRGNHVLSPPNGYAVSPDALLAAGFQSGPDDSRFSALLDVLTAQIRSLREQVSALSLDTLSQNDIDSLASAAAVYRDLESQLELLRPTPLAVSQNTDKLNVLLPDELPKLLETLADKALAVKALQPSGSSPSLVSTAVPSGPFADADELQAPFTLDQYLTTFRSLLSIFTNINGYADANIVNLATSLANDLVNIALAGVINRNSPQGNLDVDFISAGSGFSFVCPKVPGTYIEGTGFSRRTNRMAVAQVGCINNSALRSLLTLNVPGDAAAALRLIFTIRSLVRALGRNESFASDETPSSTREGLLGGLDIVFDDSPDDHHPGWSRVNQSELPCAGIVIVFNFDSGYQKAVNANLLPSCGEDR